MALAACDRCHTHFVIERNSPAQSGCPTCDQPLRAISREEALTRLRTRRTAPRPPAPTPHS